jgi:Flp pilus assembly protein TadD
MFRAAAELEPSNPVHHFNLGIVMLIQGAAGLATQEFEQALSLGPTAEQIDDVVRDLGFVQKAYGPLAGIEYLRGLLR